MVMIATIHGFIPGIGGLAPPPMKLQKVTGDV